MKHTNQYHCGSGRRKSSLETFLLVEPDIPRPVIVCRPTHGVVLGRDVLKFLRDDQYVLAETAFGV